MIQFKYMQFNSQESIGELIMKEKLYTIPLNDALNENDECPFCYIKRKVEHDLIDFVLGSGSSYMESDVRDTTDSEGFCSHHFKMMFDYGNTLGNAWILKTHYFKTLDEMKKEFKNFKPSQKQSIFSKKDIPNSNSIVKWLNKRENSCYICKRINDTFDRYLDTFFILYQHEVEFREKLANSKGFCLSHFKDLCELADSKLSQNSREEFYKVTFDLMDRNISRISDDVSWMVEKFDYRNKNADWKNSKDSIQRGMQKLKGGYPADLPYKSNR